MSEVFRFMLARAPERAADDSLVTLVTDSDFQTQLARARGEAEPREHMRALARTFVGDSPLGSEKERSVLVPEYYYLHRLAVRLGEVAETAEESKEKEGVPIAEWFLDIFTVELKPYVASEAFAAGWQRVADTLVALKIVSAAPGGVVEDFSLLSRLYALLRRSVGHQEIPAEWVAQSLGASLVLPEAAVMIGLPASPAPPVSARLAAPDPGTEALVPREDSALTPAAGTRITRIGANYWDGWYQTAPEATSRSLATVPRAIGSLQPAGLGKLLILKQRVVGYEGGEVAHVENVLKSEARERQHRSLKRTEETLTTETETTRTDEKDLQSTERFDLKSEVSSLIKEDHKLDTGVESSGKYGLVDFKAHANYNFERSKEESVKRATSYSKEITQRAVNKVVERVRVERQTKTILETEEKNLHGFDNKAGTGHISGVYQWVDRIIEAQIFDYDEDRLLFDAMVPEPAAFLLDALTTRKPEGEELVKPEDFTFAPHQIDEDNYQVYVKKYQVEDAMAPPVKQKRKAMVLSGGGESENELLHSGAIEIEDGYIAREAFLKSQFMRVNGDKFGSLRVALCRRWVEISPDQATEESGYEVTFNLGVTGNASVPPDASGPVLPGSLPLTIQALNVRSYTLAMDLILERSPRAFETWQLETHAKILKAFLVLRSAYYEKLAALMFEQNVQGGRNPDQNRLLERTELKKAAIMLLTGQQLDGFRAIDENSGSDAKYPRPNLAQAAEDGPYIRFFEQAFEWDQMTYVFYPYFWGRHDHWYQRAVLSDPDLIFAEFLRAGAARVVFPVRKGFETAILHYLETDEIWDGGPLPEISSPLYVHIANELAERNRRPGKEKPFGESWKFRLPTSLIKLRSDDQLPTLTRDWEPV